MLYLLSVWYCRIISKSDDVVGAGPGRTVFDEQEWAEQIALRAASAQCDGARGFAKRYIKVQCAQLPNQLLRSDVLNVELKSTTF